MARFAFGFGFWLAVLLSVSLGSPASAKPADLPDLNDIQCPECGEKSTPNGGITIELGLSGAGITLKVDVTRAQPALELPTPAVAPALIEQVWKIVNDAIQARGPVDCSPESLEVRSQQARRLFLLAEQLQAQGRYQAARALYQRVHALSPSGRQGRLAIERLQRVEEQMRDDAEEAGHEDSESLYRQIRERTIPLGLVEVSF